MYLDFKQIFSGGSAKSFFVRLAAGKAGNMAEDYLTETFKMVNWESIGKGGPQAVRSLLSKVFDKFDDAQLASYYSNVMVAAKAAVQASGLSDLVRIPLAEAIGALDDVLRPLIKEGKFKDFRANLKNTSTLGAPVTTTPEKPASKPAETEKKPDGQRPATERVGVMVEQMKTRGPALSALLVVVKANIDHDTSEAPNNPRVTLKEMQEAVGDVPEIMELLPERNDVWAKAWIAYARELERDYREYDACPNEALLESVHKKQDVLYYDFMSEYNNFIMACQALLENENLKFIDPVRNFFAFVGDLNDRLSSRESRDKTRKRLGDIKNSVLSHGPTAASLFFMLLIALPYGSGVFIGAELFGIMAIILTGGQNLWIGLELALSFGMIGAFALSVSYAYATRGNEKGLWVSVIPPVIIAVPMAILFSLNSFGIIPTSPVLIGAFSIAATLLMIAWHVAVMGILDGLQAGFVNRLVPRGDGLYQVFVRWIATKLKVEKNGDPTKAMPNIDLAKEHRHWDITGATHIATIGALISGWCGFAFSFISWVYCGDWNEATALSVSMIVNAIYIMGASVQRARFARMRTSGDTSWFVVEDRNAVMVSGFITLIISVAFLLFSMWMGRPASNLVTQNVNVLRETAQGYHYATNALALTLLVSGLATFAMLAWSIKQNRDITHGAMAKTIGLGLVLVFLALLTVNWVRPDYSHMNESAMQSVEIEVASKHLSP